MQDRELLELAAKAYGLHGVYEEKVWTYEGRTIRNTGILATDEDGDVLDAEARAWNPLVDDGDALRLAVRLKIDFKAYDETVRTWVGDPAAQKVIASVEELCGNDPYEATRRAIVRAAAEIGKNS